MADSLRRSCPSNLCSVCYHPSSLRFHLKGELLPSMTDLTAVIRDLESQRASIAAKLQSIETAVYALKGKSQRNGASSAISARPRRVMSAAARRRIVAAQKVRWAKWRKAQKRAA
jgi:hypothetical protein